jgi:hypothetical protein
MGDTLIVISVLTNEQPGPVSCSDSQGNGYRLDLDSVDAGDPRLVVCSTVVAAALAKTDTVTITHPGCNGRVFNIVRFSGLPQGFPVRMAAVSSSGGVDGGMMSVSASGALAGSNELAIPIFGDLGPLSDPDPGAPSGYSGLVRYGPGAVATAQLVMSTSYRIDPARSSDSAAVTLAVSRPWTAAMIVYGDTVPEMDAGTGTPRAYVVGCGCGSSGAGDTFTLCLLIVGVARAFRKSRAAMAVACLFIAARAAAQPIVHDTFTDADGTLIQNHSPEVGDPSSWLSTGRGPGFISGGAVEAQSKYKGPRVINTTPLPPGPIRVRALVYVPDRNPSDIASVIASAHGATWDSYELVLTGEGNVKLVTTKNGDPNATLAIAPITHQPDVPHELALIVGDGRQAAFYDGAPVFALEDGTFDGGGQAGIHMSYWTSSASAQIQELWIEAIDGGASGMDWFPADAGTGEPLPPLKLEVDCGCGSSPGLLVLGAVFISRRSRPLRRGPTSRA